MTIILEHKELCTMLELLKKDAAAYFDRAELALKEVSRLDRWSHRSYDRVGIQILSLKCKLP
jgi:hypothetical protein